MSSRRRGHEAYTAIVWDVGVSHEMGNIAGAEAVESVEGNTCSLAMQEAPSRRGRGPRHAQKDRVGSWETWSRPQSPLAVPGHGRKPRRRSCRGRGEGSDGQHSTCEAPNKAGLAGHGGGGGKAAGRGELVTTNDAPGTVLDKRLTSAVITGTGTAWDAQAPIAGTDDSRQEPDALTPHVRIRAGARGATRVPTATGATTWRAGGISSHAPSRGALGIAV